MVSGSMPSRDVLPSRVATASPIRFAAVKRMIAEYWSMLPGLYVSASTMIRGWR